MLNKIIILTFVVLCSTLVIVIKKGITKDEIEIKNQKNTDQSRAAGITPDDAAKILPLSPLQVRAESITGRIWLKWRGTGEDIFKYNIYRKTSSTDWQLIDSVQIVGDNTGWYEFIDETTKLGITYTYGVTAINNYETESIISESVDITQQ